MAIIEVNNLTKEYQLGHMKNLKQTVLNGVNRLCGKPVEKHSPFKALDNVSFSIEEGEVVGIIGTNGAGKSTMLKHLARISTPTSGKVSVRGSVAPLIEVGAGLNPELSGRENIFLNGAIMGIPKRVLREKFDEIVAFAELEEFIDTPIKRYSSGMAVRLGFSIATSVNPEILIVDEVLSVGDLAFQRKCFDRMEDLIKLQGKTVLIVSHNIRQVERICSRAILLDHGTILMDGEPAKVCNLFYDRSNEKILKGSLESRKTQGSVETSGEIDVEEVLIFRGESSQPTDEVGMHEPMRIGIRFTSHVDVPCPEIVVGFHTTDFVYIASTSSAVLPDRPDIKKGEGYYECKLDDLQLMPGIYCVRLAFIDQYRRMMWYGENQKIFKVGTNTINLSKMPVAGFVDFKFKWSF